MNSNAADFWNDRFSNDEFIYGTQPNIFIKEKLDKLKTRILLLPAEGEGRNSIYVAAQDWTVSAFDISKIGKEKVWVLFKQSNVSIAHDVVDVRLYKQ